MLQAEQEEEDAAVISVSLEHEEEVCEELEVFNSEDEEELGCTPLTLACSRGLTEVRCVCVYMGLCVCCLCVHHFFFIFDPAVTLIIIQMRLSDCSSCYSCMRLSQVGR